MKYLIIIIVCLVYVHLMNPIEKAVNKRISKRWVAYIVNFIIAVIILIILYWLAALMGFDAFE